jgi:hypothetical protein
VSSFLCNPSPLLLSQIHIRESLFFLNHISSNFLLFFKSLHFSLLTICTTIIFLYNITTTIKSASMAGVSNVPETISLSCSRCGNPAKLQYVLYCFTFFFFFFLNRIYFIYSVVVAQRIHLSKKKSSSTKNSILNSLCILHFIVRNLGSSCCKCMR